MTAAALTGALPTNRAISVALTIPDTGIDSRSVSPAPPVTVIGPRVTVPVNWHPMRPAMRPASPVPAQVAC